jgi:nicotinamide phosphoribosyltransferase
MSSLQDAAISGAAHLTSFWGTDTIVAIDLLEDYYLADAEKETIGTSVPATEHSVMSMGTEAGELATFKRLITEIYPSGLVSIVSDTWDFWRVVTEYLSTLKDIILARDGKLVIRPDSGDPVKIIVGDSDAPAGSPANKGAIGCLWDIFGGTMTDKGYKLLDPHIGIIYGDSVTLQHASDILAGMTAKGFASANIVFGVGSHTYQYVTRDNYGFAMKATSGVIHGERRDIYKTPKTDSGLKQSAKGLLRVDLEQGKLVLHDQQTEEQENQGLLEEVFLNGKLSKLCSLKEIRARIEGSLA